MAVVAVRHEKKARPLGRAEGVARSGATKRQIDSIVTDRLDRDRRHRIARMADELMPMAVWYRQPKDGFYCTVVEGWAA
jgi:hypothetical protein